MSRKTFFLGVLLCSTMALGQTALDLGAIREGLERSPNDYVAAVIEYHGEIHCAGPQEKRVCWTLAVVVDAVTGSLCIAWLTVGYQSVRAALTDPAKSLRND